MPQASGSATATNAPIARKRDVVAPGSWLKTTGANRFGVVTFHFAQEPIVVYGGKDGVEIVVLADFDTVWLNRQQMAKLFGRDVKTIGKHIANALKEELKGFPTVAKFATVQTEGGRSVVRQVEYYDLDMILTKQRRGVCAGEGRGAWRPATPSLRDLPSESPSRFFVASHAPDWTRGHGAEPHFKTMLRSNESR